MTLQNSNRNQKHAEDTRKIQLLMQMHNAQNSEYSMRRLDVINLDTEGLDVLNAEPETTSKILITWREWNQLGLLLKYDFIDPDMMFEFLHGSGPILHWEKYGDIIKEMRINRKLYSLGVGFEYLAEEMKKYRNKQEQTYTQNQENSLYHPKSYPILNLYVIMNDSPEEMYNGEQRTSAIV